MAPVTSAQQPPLGFQLVSAQDAERGIGRNGGFAWFLPSEYEYYKDITLTTRDRKKCNAVVIGRLSFFDENGGYPHEGILFIVLSRSSPDTVQPMEGYKDTYTCNNLQAAMDYLSSPPVREKIETVFVAGGSQIYQHAINSPLCEAIHLTVLDRSFDCTVFFPVVDSSRFRLWSCSPPVEEKGITYTINVFTRCPRAQQMKATAEDAYPSSSSCCTASVGEVGPVILPPGTRSRHEELQYLELVDLVGQAGVLHPGCARLGPRASGFGRSLAFNLRHTFPLFTTTGTAGEWGGIVRGVLTQLKSSEVLACAVERLRSSGEAPSGPLLLQASLAQPLITPATAALQLSVSSRGELNVLAHLTAANLLEELPREVAMHALMARLMAQSCGLAPGELVLVVGEAQLQLPRQADQVAQLLARRPEHLPTLRLSPGRQELAAFGAEDIALEGQA